MVKNTPKNKFISSIKYGYAVQLYHKQNGDIVYYAGYHDSTDLDAQGNPKRKRLKIGSKHQGITETYVKNKREEIVLALRMGNTLPILEKKKFTLTFIDLAKLYFEDRASQSINPENSKNIKKDQSILNKHLAIFFRHKANVITDTEIVKLKTDKLKVLAPKTVNNILTVLSAILKFGLDRKLIMQTPRIKKLVGIDNKRERYLEKEEIQRVYENIKDNPILSIFFKLALFTGARLETLRAIKVKDINFTDCSINLVDLKAKASGKNNTTYTGFFDESLRDELKVFVTGLSPNSYIFSYSKSKRVSIDYIQNNLQKLFNRLFNAGLDTKDAKNRVVIHTLRHTFATHLAKNGEPIFVIQKLMNHADLTMTLRYAKFSPENGQNAIKRLKLI